QVEQSLINLVLNARDAMPKGGRLVIECRNVDFDTSVPVATGDIPPGSYVRLCVSDSGIGIDPELLAKIFEPFFTTKSPDKGTGLGLSTVFGIVDQSHGYVEVQSELGKGSSFIIFLPVTGQTVRQPRGEGNQAIASGGNETVLLVEDEEAVRGLVSQLLTMKGYRVLEASNPGEALLIYEKQQEEIDLLISDIVMPHMDGHLLSTRLRGINPNLKIILMSGYPAQTLRDKIDEISVFPLIQKPFDANNFMTKVREVLDA
ncbi:MAG TPA: response regulator, partial [Spirochaetia bacterium]|nr:response regulator [Spirochaetia bacterium]